MNKKHVWKTREGQLLTLEEIHDNHLLNIIRFLKRRAIETLFEGYSAMCCFQGEHAQHAVETSMDAEVSLIEDRLNFFTAAARERGLHIKD